MTIMMMKMHEHRRSRSHYTEIGSGEISTLETQQLRTFGCKQASFSIRWRTKEITLLGHSLWAPMKKTSWMQMCLEFKLSGGNPSVQRTRRETSLIAWLKQFKKHKKTQINSQESTFSTVWIHWLLSHFPREALSPLPKEVMKNYKWSLTNLYLASLYLIYLGIGIFIDCPLQSGMQRMESQAKDEVRYVKYVRYANCLCKNTTVLPLKNNAAIGGWTDLASLLKKI